MTIEVQISRWHIALEVIVFLFLCLPAQGQQDSVSYKKYRHEISVGYGAGNILESPSKNNDDFIENAYKWWKGNIHLQYLYNLNEKLGLGLSADFTRSYSTKELCYNYDKYDRFIGGSLLDKKRYTNWFTVSATGRYNWFKGDNYAVYSRLGIGLAMATGAEKKVSVMPNIAPFSIEFGYERLRFFTELFEVGTYGVYNLGIKYSFCSR